MHVSKNRKNIYDLIRFLIIMLFTFSAKSFLLSLYVVYGMQWDLLAKDNSKFIKLEKIYLREKVDIVCRAFSCASLLPRQCIT